MSLNFTDYLQDLFDYEDSEDNYFGNILNNLNSGCKYHDIDSISSLSKTHNESKYTAMHINIQSLASKYDQLKTFVHTLNNYDIKLDFILLCETFLTEMNDKLYMLPGYDFVCNNRSGGKGGGVAIFIRDDIHFKVREDLTLNYGTEFESIFIETTNSSDNAIVGEIYRVPNTNEVESIKRYEDVARALSSYKGSVIIGTDQNFDFMNIETHTNTNNLLSCFITCGFIPVITKPTRITHTSSTLIDNIYIRANCEVFLSGILKVDLSDHLPVFLFLGKGTEKPIWKYKTNTKFRPLNDDIARDINEYLACVDWNCIEALDADEAYLYLKNKIQEALDIFAPEQIVSTRFKKRIREPWMTTGLLKSSGKKIDCIKKV